MAKSTKTGTFKIVICALFLSLIVIGGFIKIPLPFFGVMTMQLPFVLLTAMLIGYKLATFTALLYLTMGLAGIPVFATGGGIQYVLSPTFGFLVAFIFIAFGAGLFIHKTKTNKLWHFLVSGLIGFVFAYAVGLPYQYLIMRFYLGETDISFWTMISPYVLVAVKDIIICTVFSIIGHRLSKIPMIYDLIYGR